MGAYTDGIANKAKVVKTKVVYFCQVDGCKTKLANCKPYCIRYRVCPAHLAASSVLLLGQSSRFCQQCGKFHALEEFDGTKRSCRTRLMHHNNSRQQRRRDAAMQQALTTSLMLQQCGARVTAGRRKSTCSSSSSPDESETAKQSVGNSTSHTSTAVDDQEVHTGTPHNGAAQRAAGASGGTGRCRANSSSSFDVTSRSAAHKSQPRQLPGITAAAGGGMWKLMDPAAAAAGGGGGADGGCCHKGCQDQQQQQPPQHTSSSSNCTLTAAAHPSPSCSPPAAATGTEVAAVAAAGAAAGVIGGGSPGALGQPAAPAPLAGFGCGRSTLLAPAGAHNTCSAAFEGPCVAEYGAGMPTVTAAGFAVDGAAGPGSASGAAAFPAAATAQRCGSLHSLASNSTALEHTQDAAGYYEGLQRVFSSGSSGLNGSRTGPFDKAAFSPAAGTAATAAAGGVWPVGRPPYGHPGPAAAAAAAAAAAGYYSSNKYGVIDDADVPWCTVPGCTECPPPPAWWLALQQQRHQQQQQYAWQGPDAAAAFEYTNNLEVGPRYAPSKFAAGGPLGPQRDCGAVAAAAAAFGAPRSGGCFLPGASDGFRGEASTWTSNSTQYSNTAWQQQQQYVHEQQQYMSHSVPAQWEARAGGAAAVGDIWSKLDAANPLGNAATAAAGMSNHLQQQQPLMPQQQYEQQCEGLAVQQQLLNAANHWGSGQATPMDICPPQEPPAAVATAAGKPATRTGYCHSPGDLRLSCNLSLPESGCRPTAYYATGPDHISTMGKTMSDLTTYASGSSLTGFPNIANKNINNGSSSCSSINENSAAVTQGIHLQQRWNSLPAELEYAPAAAAAAQAVAAPPQYNYARIGNGGSSGSGHPVAAPAPGGIQGGPQQQILFGHPEPKPQVGSCSPRDRNLQSQVPGAFSPSMMYAGAAAAADGQGSSVCRRMSAEVAAGISSSRAEAMQERYLCSMAAANTAAAAAAGMDQPQLQLPRLMSRDSAGCAQLPAAAATAAGGGMNDASTSFAPPAAAATPRADAAVVASAAAAAMHNQQQAAAGTSLTVLDAPAATAAIRGLPGEALCSDKGLEDLLKWAEIPSQFLSFSEDGSDDMIDQLLFKDD